MFIVATTLALLALMGLFVLASATREVQVAGYVRQSTQAHTLSEVSMQAGASYLSPAFAGALVHDYAMGRVTGQTTNCMSAAPAAMALPTGQATAAKSCIRLMDTDMSANAFGGKFPEGPTGLSPSIVGGSTVTAPGAVIGLEITYPHGQQIAAGGGPSLHYYRATVTTFGVIQSMDSSKMETGRGHIVVGPFQD
jgi:hypothetical protein